VICNVTYCLSGNTINVLLWVRGEQSHFVRIGYHTKWLAICGMSRVACTIENDCFSLFSRITFAQRLTSLLRERVVIRQSGQNGLPETYVIGYVASSKLIAIVRFDLQGLSILALPSCTPFRVAWECAEVLQSRSQPTTVSLKILLLGLLCCRSRMTASGLDRFGLLLDGRESRSYNTLVREGRRVARSSLLSVVFFVLRYSIISCQAHLEKEQNEKD